MAAEPLVTSDLPRAEHVGSLLRPAQLRAARTRWKAGEIGYSALERVEHESIVAAVQRQQECGLTVVTDGEFRRDSWYMDFALGLDGVAAAPPGDHLVWHREDGVELVRRPAVAITAPIEAKSPILAGDFASLRAVAPAALVPKITIPSINVVARVLAEADGLGRWYADQESIWDDLVAVYRSELAALAESGCGHLQIDDTAFGHLGDAQVRAGMQASGWDPRSELDRCIERLNRVLDGRPPNLRVTLHICHGSHRGMWLSTGGYASIAERVFHELEVDRFLLEFDGDRGGELSVLEMMAADKSVGLGVVDARRVDRESRDTLISRIEQAAKHLPIERMAIATNCGFAATGEGAPLLTEDEQYRKLSLMADVAEEVWGRG